MKVLLTVALFAFVAIQLNVSQASPVPDEEKKDIAVTSAVPVAAVVSDSTPQAPTSVIAEEQKVVPTGADPAAAPKVDKPVEEKKS